MPLRKAGAIIEIIYGVAGEGASFNIQYVQYKYERKANNRLCAIR